MPSRVPLSARERSAAGAIASRSSCPMCTPYAPHASATAQWSLTHSRAPHAAHAACAASTCACSSSAVAPLTRSCGAIA
eukprot:1176109-Prymnesium_polylepis.1